MFGNKFTSTVVYADDYAELRPTLDNLHYLYVNQLSDQFNEKVTNGVVFYEILKLQNLSDHKDMVDIAEHSTDTELQQIGISDRDVQQVINNRQKRVSSDTELENNCANHYPKKDPSKEYQRYVRLPENYYENCVDLHGQSLTQTIEGAIEEYSVYRFDSRVDRIRVKQQILKKYKYNKSITDNRAEDILRQLDIDESESQRSTTTEQNRSPQRDTEMAERGEDVSDDQSVVGRIDNMESYKEHAHNLRRWSERLDALQNVIDESEKNITMYDVKSLVVDAHAIDMDSKVEQRLDHLDVEEYDVKQPIRDIVDVVLRRENLTGLFKLVSTNKGNTSVKMMNEWVKDQTGNDYADRSSPYTLSSEDVRYIIKALERNGHSVDRDYGGFVPEKALNECIDDLVFVSDVMCT